MGQEGILAGDFDITRKPPRGPAHPLVPARRGLVVEHRSSGTVGTVVKLTGRTVVVRDEHGKDRGFPLVAGAFTVGGEPVELVLPTGPDPNAAPEARRITASGSIDAGPVAARVARASRIYVEGIHDAELVEKVWGDDLRWEGVVVEQMGGADDLTELVSRFDPGPTRRLGVLLDHLVDGTKEARLATAAAHPFVLVTGHPYVDIWQAVKPRVVGIEAWPEVPPGRPWKEGVLAALGYHDTPGAFWKQLLGRVTDYRDLEPGLLSAVEQLIDFVAPPDPED